VSLSRFHRFGCCEIPMLPAISSQILFTAIVLILPIYGQSSAGIEPSINTWHHRPTQAAPPPEDPTARQLWSIRGDNFDRDTGVPYALDNPAATAAHIAAHPGAGSTEDRYYLTNPLPVKDSDAVVIATFSNYEVELSPSKHSLYTVVHFTIERVLKSKYRALLPGDTIDSLFTGGTLNLNGRVISFRVNHSDHTPLEEHQRYLLFLKYSSKSESYSIIKHWKLELGQVTAVDLVEKRRATNGTSDFNGHSESEIIAATEEAIRSERSTQ